MPQESENAVPVHSVQEEYFYMMVHPCACGGAWLGSAQEVQESPAEVVHRLTARCSRCRKERFFLFRLSDTGNSQGPIRQINPTLDPSCAIDLAEWMDLAQFYLGRIDRLTRPVEKAQSLLDARQCLEEALKFFGPADDAPPPSALWSEASRAKAARQSNAFRRTTIEAMLARMPPMDRLRQADSLDQKDFEKTVRGRAKERAARWWQFWKLFRRRD